MTLQGVLAFIRCSSVSPPIQTDLLTKVVFGIVEIFEALRYDVVLAVEHDSYNVCISNERIISMGLALCAGRNFIVLNCITLHNFRLQL